MICWFQIKLKVFLSNLLNDMKDVVNGQVQNASILEDVDDSW